MVLLFTTEKVLISQMSGVNSNYYMMFRSCNLYRYVSNEAKKFQD